MRCTPLLFAALTACGSPTEDATPPASDPAPGSAAESVQEPISLEGWNGERIELPPDFAPTLPPGEEVLLFAPGMFDVTAEDYWSYVFLIRIEQESLDADSLTSLLETYYDGLVLSVAGAKRMEVPADPATVQLKSEANGRVDGTVDLVDAFNDGRAITVNLRMRVAEIGDGNSVFRVRASPQPDGHAVWEQLTVALRSLEL